MTDVNNLNPYQTFHIAKKQSTTPVAEGYKCYAGKKLLSENIKQTKASAADIVAALRTVYDPEIPVNIFDIGLIYDILQSEDGDIEVVMTLTSPNCPVAELLPQQVADTVSSIPGVGKTLVRLTWSPAWNTDMMNEDVKMALGMI